MNIPKIPKELIARPQWVCYGKDKVPVNPKTGGNAQSNNPETWATFSEALKYYERHKNNGIAGIGYEFSYYDKYTGVDWDDCRDPKTGQLKFCAQILVNYLSSFTENSPSKTGIHILLAGKLPAGADNKKTLNCGGQIEVYSVDRYFTVTGNHLQETPATIEDRNKELKAFHAQVIAKPKAPPKSAGPRNGNGASGGVIDAFNKVYEAGSILEKKAMSGRAIAGWPRPAARGCQGSITLRIRVGCIPITPATP